jgi:hypothetical protein
MRTSRPDEACDVEARTTVPNVLVSGNARSAAMGKRRNAARRQTLTLADLAHAQSWVVPPGQDDPDRAILWISTDATLVHWILADPPGGKGYVWEVVGVQYADMYARSRSIWIDITALDATLPAITIVIRAYRVYTPQREVYVEAWLHSPEDVIERIHQPPIMTPDEYAEAHKALPHAWKLLKGLTRRGRPKGSGQFPDAASLCAAVVPILRDLKSKGRWPSQQRVADVLLAQRPPSPHPPLVAHASQVRREFKRHIGDPERMDWNTWVKKNT